MRLFCAGVGLILAAVTTDAARVEACGDKFLMAVEGMREGNSLPSLRPGRILMFRNGGSKVALSVINDGLRETLERVGHTVEVVESADALAAALDAGPFDLVLADIEDVGSVDFSQPDLATGRPFLLPVVYQASWTEVNRLKKVHRLVLNAPSRLSQVLTLVEEAMKASRGGS